MTACAEISTDDGVEYVYNVIAVEPADYQFLQDIWPSMADGRRLQWIDELEPGPGYVKPVWLKWTSQADGWYPPVEDLSAEEDAS